MNLSSWKQRLEKEKRSIEDVLKSLSNLEKLRPDLVGGASLVDPVALPSEPSHSLKNENGRKKSRYSLKPAKCQWKLKDGSLCGQKYYAKKPSRRLFCPPHRNEQHAKVERLGRERRLKEAIKEAKRGAVLVPGDPLHAGG